MFIEMGILSYHHLIPEYNLSSFYICEILEGNEIFMHYEFGML